MTSPVGGGVCLCFPTCVCVRVCVCARVCVYVSVGGSFFRCVLFSRAKRGGRRVKDDPGGGEASRESLSQYGGEKFAGGLGLLPAGLSLSSDPVYPSPGHG